MIQIFLIDYTRACKKALPAIVGLAVVAYFFLNAKIDANPQLVEQFGITAVYALLGAFSICVTVIGTLGVGLILCVWRGLRGEGTSNTKKLIALYIVLLITSIPATDAIMALVLELSS